MGSQTLERKVPLSIRHLHRHVLLGQMMDTTVQGTQLRGSRKNTVSRKGLGILRSQMR